MTRVKSEIRFSKATRIEPQKNTIELLRQPKTRNTNLKRHDLQRRGASLRSATSAITAQKRFWDSILDRYFSPRFLDIQTFSSPSGSFGKSHQIVTMGLEV